jgi:DNA-binding beta-propeller fold protein YncE
MALTTVVPGRVWDFSHAVGRNAAAGKGFAQPYGLALGPDKGVVYVVNRGNETNFGSRVSKVYVGGFHEEDLLGEFGYYGMSDGQMQWPNSVAVDKEGNVYVSDDWLNRISVFNADGNFQRHWGTTGTGQGELNGPAGLAFDHEDNLYVVDSRNHRVQIFSKQGHYMSSFGKQGTGPGELNAPWGLTIDAEGAIYIADWKNNRVQKFDADGKHLADFGRAKELNHPSDVAVDPDGDVYVCDWGNSRIRIYDANGEPLASLVGDAQILAKWAQESVDANPDMAKMRRRVPSLEEEWRFCYPVGVVFDPEQWRVIVTDNQRGRLQIYMKDKEYLEPQANL